MINDYIIIFLLFSNDFDYDCVILDLGLNKGVTNGGKRGKNPPKRLNDLAIISSNFKICQKIDEVSICEPKFFK